MNQITYLICQGHDVHILAEQKTKSPVHPEIDKFKLMEKVTYADYYTSHQKRYFKAFPKLLKLLKSKPKSFFQSLNFFKHGRFSASLRLPTDLFAVQQLNEDFDIVHAHFGYMGEIFLSLKQMGFFQNAELITTFHGVDMKPTELKKNRRRYQNIFQQNVRLTTNNPYGKELIQKIKPNYENISILPVGLDTEYFKGKIKNQNFTVLFCGRFVEFKAAVLIPEIAEYLKKDGQLNDTQFVLIGSGSQDRKIRKLVKNYKLQNHFKMLGDLTQDQVKKEMQKASVFLMPGIVESSGRAETQGLVIQEAQAMQVPVLVSDAGGMKYGMSNSKTGYVIPENDIAGYAEKIKFFKDNPEKRKQMGKAAREYVLKNFDSKVLGKQLEKIYREAL